MPFEILQKIQIQKRGAVCFQIIHLKHGAHRSRAGTASNCLARIIQISSTLYLWVWHLFLCITAIPKCLNVGSIALCTRQTWTTCCSSERICFAGQGCLPDPPSAKTWRTGHCRMDFVPLGGTPGAQPGSCGSDGANSPSTWMEINRRGERMSVVTNISMGNVELGILLHIS